MAQKRQTYNEPRLLKRLPLSTTGIPTEYHSNLKIMCCVRRQGNATKAKLLNFATTQNSLLFASMMIFPMFNGMTFLVAVKIMWTCCFLPFITNSTQLLIYMPPMKEASSRKRTVLSKPWITTGLKVSVRMKNKLYVLGDEVR